VWSFLFTGFLYIYFVEMIFERVGCKHIWFFSKSKIEIPFIWEKDWEYCAQLPFFSPSFSAKVLTWSIMIIHSNLLGPCHELLRSLNDKSSIICLLWYFLLWSFFLFILILFLLFLAVFLDYFWLVISPSLATFNDGELSKSSWLPGVRATSGLW
jgi:hypothetical protein